MDQDVFSTRLSERATKRLFFNAEQDQITKAIFQDAAHLKVARPAEVRMEEKPVNPFEDIDRRNAELEEARQEALRVPDPTRILIKEPSKAPSKIETVSLEELPLVVRQAAEASLLRKLRRPKG